jgi:hypothetical protein
VRGRSNWKFRGSFSAYQENLLFDFIVNGEFHFYGPGGIGSHKSAALPLTGAGVADSAVGLNVVGAVHVVNSQRSDVDMVKVFPTAEPFRANSPLRS